MENNFDKGKALFRQQEREKERAKQVRAEREQKFKYQTSWTKTEISYWLDDYLNALRTKLGPGLHLKCDKSEKTILVMGPFSIGLDISVGGYQLLKEDDVELTKTVLESVEFIITFPSKYTLGKYIKNDDIEKERSIKVGMHEFIIENIKGSKNYAGSYKVKGATNLELILGSFSLACEAYLEKSANKTPPWNKFIARKKEKFKVVTRLLGEIILFIIMVWIIGEITD